MKRKYSASSYQIPRKKTRGDRRNYRPRNRVQYDNLVVPRPVGLSPLATRGWQFPNNGEKKVIDIAVGSVAVTTTGSINLLNGCIQGTDYTQRIGRKIVLKSLYIRGWIQTTLADDPILQYAPQIARMMVVVDNQPNGTVFNITDLLVTASPAAQLNLNNRDRFSVLSDKEFVFDPVIVNTSAADKYAGLNRTIHPIKKYKKLNMETIFNAGNAGTIGDMNSGAIYMVWIGNTAAGGEAPMDARISTRIRFVDP